MKKRVFSLICISCIATAILFSSCKKKYIISVSHSCSNCANVKILDADPDPDASFQFFINDAKVTGESLSFADLFPASIEYSAIPSGNITVTVKQVVNDSVFNAVGSGSVTVEAGKRYGIIWTGETGKTPVILVDNKDMPTDSGYIMANFVNLIQENQTVDVVSQTTGETVFSAVPYNGVKDYVKLPASDTYIIRESGTNIHLYTHKLSLSQTRNYTFYALGKKYDTLSSSSTHIFLDYYTNGYPKTE